MGAGEMKCLEVQVNGRKVCLAGREGAVGCNVQVTSSADGTAEVSVSGTKSLQEDYEFETLKWGKQGLVVGDEIIVRLLVSDSADEPIEIERRSYKAEVDKVKARYAQRSTPKPPPSDTVTPSEDAQLYCSFCGLASKEVATLI